MEDKNSMIQEAQQRLKTEAPDFFKKLQQIGNWLTGLSGALVGIPAALEAAGLADVNVGLLLKIASYALVAGVCITAVSKFPNK